MPEPGATPALTVLTDEEVSALLTPDLAVRAARRALEEAHAGALVGPPRVQAELNGQRMVFTVGRQSDGWFGFRVRGGATTSEEATLLWDDSGSLRALIRGSELGVRRTGALGAVAVDVMARRDASSLAVIGTGRQAWAQVWAIGVVRNLEQVLVFSRNADRRGAFAARVRAELGVDATAVDDPAEGVRAASIVILATTASSPVIQPTWIRPGTHVSTVGAKARGRHEAPVELGTSARVVVSDSPAQARAMPQPFFLDRSLESLGSVMAGERPGRQDADDITLYCSTGLAGSEVVVARSILNVAPQ